MEFVLIHRWISLPPNMLEVSKAVLELVKKRKELCPQAKEIASYWSMFGGATANAFCVWEAPSIEALQPLLSQFMNLGLTTEIIPVMNIDAAMTVLEEYIKKLKETS